MEDGEETLEHKGLGAEEFTLDFAVFGRPAEGCAAAFFASLLLASFGEESLVLAGGFVRCEVGGEDDVSGVVGQVVGVWFLLSVRVIRRPLG